MPAPPTGTVTNSGNYRTSNWLFSGWGVFQLCGVAADDTYAYALTSANANANIDGGATECHLMRIPWATWTVAATEKLASFTRTTGSVNANNALGRRPSDGLLVATLNDGDLYTFAPADSYTPTYLGDSGGAPSAEILSVDFDPADGTIIWRGGYNAALARWKIGTGLLTAYPMTSYTARFSANGSHAVGVVNWDFSSAPRGVSYWNPADRMPRYPFGLRTVGANRAGVGNGNHAENDPANRAAISNCPDVCVDNAGRIYAVGVGGGLFYCTSDWSTVSIYAGTSAVSRSRVAVSPDGTKVVYSNGENLYRVT